MCEKKQGLPLWLFLSCWRVGDWAILNEEELGPPPCLDSLTQLQQAEHHSGLENCLQLDNEFDSRVYYSLAP